MCRVGASCFVMLSTTSHPGLHFVRPILPTASGGRHNSGAFVELPIQFQTARYVPTHAIAPVICGAGDAVAAFPSRVVTTAAATTRRSARGRFCWLAPQTGPAISWPVRDRPFIMRKLATADVRSDGPCVGTTVVEGLRPPSIPLYEEMNEALPAGARRCAGTSRFGPSSHGVAVSPFTTRGYPRPIRNIERRGVATCSAQIQMAPRATSLVTPRFARK
jgi:hypothetical protein